MLQKLNTEILNSGSNSNEWLQFYKLEFNSKWILISIWFNFIVIFGHMKITIKLNHIGTKKVNNVYF